MLDYTSNKKSGTGPVGNVFNVNAQWFDTLTARVGAGVGARTLLYFQGGVAWSQTSSNVTNAGVQIGQISNNRTGWTFGAGVEYLFAPNWSVFLEYNYMQFRSASYNLTGACAANCPLTFSMNDQNVLLGLNFRFHP